MRRSMRLAVATVAGSLLFHQSFDQVAQAAVPRPAGTIGTIIQAVGDDQIRFVSDAKWQLATVQQDLLAGDLLVTGPQGLLALRFTDQTMIRMTHNSQLLVKSVPPGGTAQLQLQNGGIWARAATGGTGIDVETPAATAAIRGTDWTLDVNGDKTTLKVQAGTVVLRNALGSVSVSAGEAAIAAIGKAPSKVVVTRPAGHEQFLFDLDARSAFQIWPVDDLLPAEERALAVAIKTKAPEARSTEDLVSLAEVSLHLDGNDAAQVALNAARQRSDLTNVQNARLGLVTAMLEGRHRNWKLAAQGFARVQPALSGTRLYGAVFGEYAALSLDHRPTEAKVAFAKLQAIPVATMKEPVLAELAQAWIEAVAGDMPKAIDRVKKTQSANAKDPRPPLFAGQLAVLLSREQEARDYIGKAMAIDPDDAETLNMLATIQNDYDFDYDAAERTLRRAVRQAPGDANVWNSLGLVLQNQGDKRGAEQAFRRAIELDPEDTVAPANYAILLLDADQLDAAQQQFNRALAIDPSYYAAILAKGRWQIQRGDVADAKNTFLNSVASDPTIAQSAQGLAIGYYEGGEVKRAEQQLDAADRLDPRDPITPLIRTVIALDQSEADTALVNARESFKRYRARGGVYSSLAQSRTDGSYLNSAFNKLGLTDWSRYYGDLVFNPFDSSSLFYQATVLQHQPVFTDAQPRNDNAMSALTQGILLDPLSISSRNRFTDLFRRPFVDVTAGGSMTMSDSGEVGWGADGDVEGFLNKGLPLSFSFSYGHSQSDPWRRDSLNNTENANLFIGTAPTLDDRFVLWGRFSDLKDEIPRGALTEGVVAGSGAKALETGIGYSHSFGARNHLNAVFEATTGDAHLFNDTTIADFFGFGPAHDNIAVTIQTTSFFGGLSHTIDLGPLTLSYGAEGQKSDTNEHQSDLQYLELFAVSSYDSSHTHQRPRMGRLFADIRAPLGHGFSLEGGANFDRYKDETIDRGRVDPRIALAWQPVEGQWLRVGYRQDLVLPMMNSLSPVNTLGLVPASTPLGGGSTVKTAMARWDAEWSPHFFTSIDYEHQWLTGYSLTIQDALGSVGAEEGHLDRLTGSANAWLGNGFGAFASITYARSRDTSPGSTGGDLPFVPDWQSNFGVTWVSPAQLSVTLAESIIGQRISASNGTKLDTVALTNLAVDWQPLEKRLDLGFEVLNIFDKNYEIASGIPAPGRTFLVSGHVRF